MKRSYAPKDDDYTTRMSPGIIIHYWTRNGIASMRKDAAAVVFKAQYSEFRLEREPETPQDRFLYRVDSLARLLEAALHLGRVDKLRELRAFISAEE